jgi:hypothetical protein
MVQVLERIPSFGERFANQITQGLGRGVESAMPLLQKRLEERDMAKALVSRGLSPEDANLYVRLSTGGQTEFAKNLLESRKRGLLGNRPARPAGLGAQAEPGMAGEEAKTGMQQPVQEPGEEEINDFIGEQDEGLTPAERVRRGSERFKTGLPLHKEATEKLHALSENKRRFDILDDLNKSKKLPKGLGRINVDAEGNLRAPFLASKESERYIKTLNELASGAKGTYGSRVTNFDLQQYMRQFPTLLNSAEGREQLLEQLKIVNDINSVYYKNLKNVFSRAGGVRKIDADIASEIADQISQPQIEKLAKKFSEIGTEKSLPAAHKNKGQRFQDEETGEIFMSDGRQWIKEG